MKLTKTLAGILSLAIAGNCLFTPITTSADITESAWISGNCAVVYPYSNAQKGTIMNGTKEYLTLADENGALIYGDIAKIKLSLDNVSTGFQVVELTMDFDSDKFTYLSHNDDVLYGGVLSRATKSMTYAHKVYQMENPIVKLVSASLDQITATGDLTELNFFVPQGTKAGLYPISVTIDDYGYKPDKAEIDLPCVVLNSGFISVPGCAENSESIDFGENTKILSEYIEANLIDTNTDGVEGCSVADIFWSQYRNDIANNSFNIGNIAALELGLRGDANLDGNVDAKDAALIAKYQSELSASGIAPVMNVENNNLALTLANVNNDVSSNGTYVSGCIDAKDASSVAKFSGILATYPSDADAYTSYVEIWTQLDMFGK